MAATIYAMHATAPERRKIALTVRALHDGAVILYPTDTGFAFGCELSNKTAIARLRALRHMPDNKMLTFLCDSLSNIAEYANVSNHAYKTLKRLIPGPFTFILPASKNVPRYAQNPKRKTTGIRVPEHLLCQQLLAELGNPLLSITAKTEDGEYIDDPEELVETFARRVDVVLQLDDYGFLGDSTVVDMTSDAFDVVREGAGFDRLQDHMNVTGGL